MANENVHPYKVEEIKKERRRITIKYTGGPHHSKKRQGAGQGGLLKRKIILFTHPVIHCIPLYSVFV